MTTPQETSKMPRTRLSFNEGFKTLTLDPSPRLRASRVRMSTQDPVTLAWRLVGRAVALSIRSMGQVLR